MPTESNENREQNKALEFWEGMFGDLVDVYAHGRFINYREFIRRFDSVLEQERLQSQIEILKDLVVRQKKYISKASFSDDPTDGQRQEAELTLKWLNQNLLALEQQLKTLRGEK